MQRKSRPAGQQTEQIQRRRHGRLERNAAPQAQRHDQGERYVLPEDPMPGGMLDVPPLERGRDVERQLEIQRVDRDAERPVLRRRVQQDEPERQRNEASRGQAAEKLHGEEHRQRRRQRRQQGDHAQRRWTLRSARAAVRRRFPSRWPAGVTNICASVCAVVIHAPSSKPAPTAPRMSARPKVDNRPFRVEMNVPMSTARRPSQGMRVGGARRRAVRAGTAAAGAVRAHQCSLLCGRPPRPRPTSRAPAGPSGRPHRR